MKPTIHIKPGECASMVIIRLYKHIRRANRSYEPASMYAKQVNARRHQLRVVK